MDGKKSIIVGNKNLTIRKWKGKDKKVFVSELKNRKGDEESIMNSLVYDCIDEDVTLSSAEFKYVLSRIRAFSLGEELEFNFRCDKCGEEFKKTLKLEDIIRYSYKNIKEINVNNIKIKLGEIKNRKFYETTIASNPEEKEIYDFLLRIDSFNGNDSFTLDDIVDMFDNLEVDELEEILRIWDDAKFKIDDINIITCPNESCNNEMKYIFDELPGFFPDKWFK